MAMRAHHHGLLVAAGLVLALIAPSSASAACLSSTPNSWTVTDPVDQDVTGFTEITALHVAIDGACRLTMSLDVSGPIDSSATGAFYDIDSDGVPGTDRSVQVPLMQPSAPILLGIGGGGGILYQPVPGITRIGTTGWSATLDTLSISKPTHVLLRASVWELPPTGTGDLVPDNYSTFGLDLATVSDADRPVATALPTVSGDPDVGHVLACSDGSWTNATSFAREWLRDESPIAGATGTTYTTVPADVGHLVACQVTASGPAGSAIAASAGLAIVDETAPSILKLTMTPHRFKAARSGAVVKAAAAAAGARISYRLSESATVTVSIQQRSAKTHRFKTLKGRLNLAAKAGANGFRFMGRWSGKTLKPGTYRMLLVARDAAGNASRAAAIGFRIL